MHVPCPTVGLRPQTIPGRVAGESAKVGLLVTSWQTRFHSPGQSYDDLGQPRGLVPSPGALWVGLGVKTA